MHTGAAFRILLALLSAAAATRPVSGGERISGQVVFVSVDGLRPDAISRLGPEQLPHFHRLQREGAWTHDARTDVEETNTNPNHVSMFTARPVHGEDGHGYKSNSNIGTIHQVHGAYVTSVFDLVHDHGLSTALLLSKPKLSLLRESYDAGNGREDPVPPDNGRNKIDFYFLGEINGAAQPVIDRFIQVFLQERPAFTALHLWDPDYVGHLEGWDSPDYDEAVRRVDGYLGAVLATLASDPQLAASTTLILTADHGGTGVAHTNAAVPLHYTVPFYVWGAGVTASGDLYALNLGSRRHPGTGQPPYEGTGSPPPIRNADAGNLALQLLGLPPIPDAGARTNRNQDLRISGDPGFLVWDSRVEDGLLSLRWTPAGPGFRYTVERRAAGGSASWAPVPGHEWPIDATTWTAPQEAQGPALYRVRARRVPPQ